MKVLIVGSGGREHALAWKISQSPLVGRVYCAPGNAGIAQLAECVPISAIDIRRLAEFAERHRIDLTVVGPEAPLVAGIVDRFEQKELPIFGPKKDAARIEGSKVFAKRLMKKAGIPTAPFRIFADLNKARDYARAKANLPCVIKVDGLVSGKGVFICHTPEDVDKAIYKIRKFFGKAGGLVLVEEKLEGREVSLLAFVDKGTVQPLIPACDYKTLQDGGQGPNTGGMGGYAPAEFLTPTAIKEIVDTIFAPVINALTQEGIFYKGVLYAGLMITEEGPQVLEFNCRFGDPETQVQLPLLETDLVKIMLAIVEDKLASIKIDWSRDSCVGVVLASVGYPGQTIYPRVPIIGLENLEPGILTFHMNTERNGTGFLADGGRVMTIVAKRSNLVEAREAARRNLPWFEGRQYHNDIADVPVQLALGL